MGKINTKDDVAHSQQLICNSLYIVEEMESCLNRADSVTEFPNENMLWINWMVLMHVLINV